MHKLPLVVVEWDDTTTRTKWFSEKEAGEIQSSPNISVGWKLKSSRKILRITPMRTEDRDCTDIQIIPRGCITKIRRLE